MKALQKQLAGMFRVPRQRESTAQRRARERAQPIAERWGIEIEPLRPGMNVWPPKGFRGIDPFEGDHFAQDWEIALSMVRAYASAIDNKAR